MYIMDYLKDYFLAEIERRRKKKIEYRQYECTKNPTTNGKWLLEDFTQQSSTTKMPLEKKGICKNLVLCYTSTCKF